MYFIQMAHEIYQDPHSSGYQKMIGFANNEQMAIDGIIKIRQEKVKSRLSGQ